MKNKKLKSFLARTQNKVKQIVVNSYVTKEEQIPTFEITELKTTQTTSPQPFRDACTLQPMIIMVHSEQHQPEHMLPIIHIGASGRND